MRLQRENWVGKAAWCSLRWPPNSHLQLQSFLGLTTYVFKFRLVFFVAAWFILIFSRIHFTNHPALKHKLQRRNARTYLQCGSVSCGKAKSYESTPHSSWSSSYFLSKPLFYFSCNVQSCQILRNVSFYIAGFCKSWSPRRTEPLTFKNKESSNWKHMSKRLTEILNNI